MSSSSEKVILKVEILQENTEQKIHLLSEMIFLHLHQHNHTNLIKTVGIWHQPSKTENIVYSAFESCGRGTLRQCIHNPTELTWKIRLNIARDISLALTFLHENKFIHRYKKKQKNSLNISKNPKIND
jgi:serine/threonine protein kinase